MANEAMEAAWNGEEGEHWAGQAQRYDAVGVAVHDAHLARIRTSPDSRILDVGCGAGGLTLELAQRCADGAVLGVDLSSQLLEVAAKRAAAAGLANVEFVRADAQTHEFADGSFDIAVSSFGVMFFDDPAAAFRNIASALKPGAELVVAVWRDLRENEWLMRLRDALAMGRDLPFPPPDAPTPFSLADRDRTTRLLGEAGFSGVEFEAVDEPMLLGSDADDAFAFVSTMGIVRGLTHDLDESTRTEALANLRQLLAESATPRGVELGAAAWIISAGRDS